MSEILETITSSLITFTVAMLLVATLGGIYGQARKRVFFGGFAIGAWGFLLLAYGASDLDTFGSQMLTTDALNFVERACFGDPSSNGSVGQNPFDHARWQLDFIGNCVFTLTFGILCGFVAICFAGDAFLPEQAGLLRAEKLSALPRMRAAAATSSRDD